MKIKTKEMETKSWKEIKDTVYGEKGTDRRDELERDFESFKIGLLLKKAREEKQLTQSELAELVDKKREYISRVENNGSNLTLKTLYDIVEKGLGGLGHMGVKFAKAMGAHVVMITTSESKGADAMKLEADEVLISKDAAQMKQHFYSFDFLLNTIPVAHDVNPYLLLLKLDKTMCMVGAIEPLPNVHGGVLINKRRNIAGSLIGGIKETQEMLDFCGKTRHCF